MNKEQKLTEKQKQVNKFLAHLGDRRKTIKFWSYFHAVLTILMMLISTFSIIKLGILVYLFIVELPQDDYLAMLPKEIFHWGLLFVISSFLVLGFYNLYSQHFVEIELIDQIKRKLIS